MQKNKVKLLHLKLVRKEYKTIHGCKIKMAATSATNCAPLDVVKRSYFDPLAFEYQP